MTINLTDPANHPANSPLPVQRIERVIEALESSLKYRNGSTLDNVLADAVKGLRELLVSREAVPVADVVSWHKYGEERTCDIRWRRFDVAPGPLYAAPPAPGVPDDLLSMAASAIEDLLEHADPHTSYYSGVWADVPGKLRAAALQESPKGAGAPLNCRSNGKVQVVQKQSGTTHTPETVQNVDHVDEKSQPGIQTAPELGSMPKNAGLLPSMNSTPVNDGTTGKPLTITLPDISSKAFWSGTGKHEVFHPETYRRWVKEAIERDCTIAKIEVKVK